MEGASLMAHKATFERSLGGPCSNQVNQLNQFSHAL